MQRRNVRQCLLIQGQIHSTMWLPNKIEHRCANKMFMCLSVHCLLHHRWLQQPCCRIIITFPTSLPSYLMPVHHHPSALYLLHAFQACGFLRASLSSPHVSYSHPHPTPVPRCSGLHGTLRTEADKTPGSHGAAAAPDAILSRPDWYPPTHHHHHHPLRMWQQQQQQRHRYQPTPYLPQLQRPCPVLRTSPSHRHCHL